MRVIDSAIPEPPQGSAEDTLALLRQQLAGLLAQVDTASKPKPDRIYTPRTPPAQYDSLGDGPEWRPVERWVVRAVDGDEPGFIYVAPPDIYDHPDYKAMHSAEARHLAMALLAAADWADGIVRIDLPGRKR